MNSQHPITEEHEQIIWENVKHLNQLDWSGWVSSNALQGMTPLKELDVQSFIKGNEHLLALHPVPKPPNLKELSISSKLHSIRKILYLISEKYLSKLGYNHLGICFFDIKKKTCFRQLMRQAQEMY